MSLAWRVFLKELVDALRDRRTLFAVFLSAVATGPLFLILLSTLASDMEQRAEAREVWTRGMAQAPTLRNYIERQTWVLREAPADYETQLRNRQLGDPVLVVAPGFDAALARGETPQLTLVSDSGNPRATAGARRVEALLRGFQQERVALMLSWRGVSPAALQTVQLESVDLASPGARAASLTAMLPFFVLMAVLYGALNAALDTTAGERERGSLEPLLMNPVSRWSLVMGKWGAVAAVAMGIAVLSCFSFLPGQWLLRSEMLAAMFRFGPQEAAGFLWLLLPLAGALAAVLMAVASRGRSVKEAQASATVLTLVVSLLPLVSTMSQDGEKPWHLWVPVVAQSTLMTRVLKGELVGLGDVLLPALVCLIVMVAALGYVVRQLGQAVQR